MSAYGDALELWPVGFESQQIQTRFGTTHALVSGPANGRPLLLIPAAIGIGAVQWFPNAEYLAASRRVIAVDFLGGPGLGHQTRPILDQADCAQWVVDLLDSESDEPADVVGSSQGGWLALNAAVNAPDRIARLALLAPAASFLPFRLVVRAMLKIGPYLPSITAGPSLRASFGHRYAPDKRLLTLTRLGLKHFRYQPGAVFPDVFSDADLRGVKSNTIVIAGDREIIYQPRLMLDRAASTIAGAETHLVSGAGHLLNMERPDEINTMLGNLFTT